MFKLGNIEFEINDDKSKFYVHEEDGKLEFALDIATVKREYRDEQCALSLDIGYFKTDKTEIQGLVGMEVSVSSIEEADEREDTFYLYEHEPFVEYKLKIIDIQNKNVHVYLKGTVVEDGYAKPYTTAPIEIDCYLKTK